MVWMGGLGGLGGLGGSVEWVEYVGEQDGWVECVG